MSATTPPPPVPPGDAQRQADTPGWIEQEKLAALGRLVPSVVHEVNGPLSVAMTATSGLTDFARELLATLGAERVSRAELQSLARRMLEAAEMVGGNLARASELMGHFKTLSVDQVHEELSRVDLCAYLQTVLRTHAAVLRHAQIQVELDLPPRCMATLVPGLLAQVLSNLLLNAVHHAFEGRDDRRLRIALRPLGAERVELRLRDNGRGVAPELRPRLFQPFYTTRREQGGSGLGLYIVQQLCQQMGGTVRLDETPGPGLGFIIELPLTPPAPPATSPPG